MTRVAHQLPSWWPGEAVRCYTDLCEYRLVGASACADRIIAAVAALAAAAEDSDLVQDVGEALADAGQLFRALKPDTSLYSNVLDFLLSLEVTADAIAAGAQAIMAYRSDAQQRVADVAAEALRDADSILVHDYSSAVLRVLAACADDGGSREVIVTECALLGQGPRVAACVAGLGHRVVYGSDCSMGRLVARADAFLTGVECFYADGSLANTAGSLPIALLCREFEAQVVAPAELLKLDRSNKTASRDALHARLLHPWPIDAKLREQISEIEDHVLDAVPAGLVTYYATELGRLSPIEVGAAALQAMHTLREPSGAPSR